MPTPQWAPMTPHTFHAVVAILGIALLGVGAWLLQAITYNWRIIARIHELEEAYRQLKEENRLLRRQVPRPEPRAPAAKKPAPKKPREKKPKPEPRSVWDRIKKPDL